VKLAENTEVYAQRKYPQILTNIINFQQAIVPPQVISRDSMQINTVCLHSAERMCRLQQKLCLYYEKPSYFKNNCEEVAVVPREYNQESSQEDQNYREEYYETTYNKL
jgi:hypothetical protein